MSKSLTDKKEWPKGMIFWPISLFDSTIVATSIFLKRNVESRSSLLLWVKKLIHKVFFTLIYMKEKTRNLAQTFLHTHCCVEKQLDRMHRFSIKHWLKLLETNKQKINLNPKWNCFSTLCWTVKKVFKILYLIFILQFTKW